MCHIFSKLVLGCLTPAFGVQLLWQGRKKTEKQGKISENANTLRLLVKKLFCKANQ